MRMNNKTIFRVFCLFLLALLTISCIPVIGFSEESKGTYKFTNEDTGFRAIILDDLRLLTEEERDHLLEDMEPITKYGNVAFWSTRESASNEVEQARLKRRELFGLESATILVINMNLRKVSIQSYGALYDIITIDRANTITNNVRNLLTFGEYYSAANRAYSQIDALMKGEQIPQPMKYLSNLAIALIASLILMMNIVFRHASSFTKPEHDPIKEVIAAVTLGSVSLKATRRVPRSSSSGSGCSSCSSCGGGSSCSSCGGGGSSSF